MIGRLVDVAVPGTLLVVAVAKVYGHRVRDWPDGGLRRLVLHPRPGPARSHLVVTHRPYDQDRDG